VGRQIFVENDFPRCIKNADIHGIAVQVGHSRNGAVSCKISLV
jgi:hypothetical protein